jgi:hypothetical protein
VEERVDGVEQWWWCGASPSQGPIAGIDLVVAALRAPGSTLAYFEGHGIGEGLAWSVVTHGVAVEVDQAVKLR